MNWSRFKTHFYHHTGLGLALDVSRIPFPDEFLVKMAPKVEQAFADMAALERGVIANPDEPTYARAAVVRAHLAALVALTGKETADVDAGIAEVVAALSTPLGKPTL